MTLEGFPDLVPSERIGNESFEMLLTYRFKLKPTRAQYLVLDRILESQRQLYNAALQERVDAWQKAKLSISKIDQTKSLTVIRAEDETYRALPVSLSRWSIARVDDVMKGFFRRVKRGSTPGFPRFRGKGRWQSFGFDEFSGIRLQGDRLLIKSMDGALRFNLHRPIPDGASIKTCTFTKIGRHWWIAMAMDIPTETKHPHPDSVIGVDLGVMHLATTSDGVHIANPKPRSRREKELRLSQRALARCQRGSKRRAKVKERLAKIHRRIANERNNYLHQVSADLTKRYALIGVEKLQVKNMTRSAKGTVEKPGSNVRQKAGLNRGILDAAPAKFLQMLTYKAERAGGKVVKVNPNGTSQECSSCGTKVMKDLSERVHSCECGTVLDRDHNAALNVLHRALRHDGRAMPPGGANVGHWPERCPGNADLEDA